MNILFIHAGSRIKNFKMNTGIHVNPKNHDVIESIINMVNFYIMSRKMERENNVR